MAMTDTKRQYAVTFQRSNGKTATFFRWGRTEAWAISEAKDGFQWAYGYYPDEPIKTEDITPDA